MPTTDIPPDYTPVITGTPATATPRQGEVRPTVLSPTLTPLRISRITDLAPDLPRRDKAEVIVQHPDGTFEVYLIRYDMDRSELPLGSEDVITGITPPQSLMGHKPPEPPAAATPTGMQGEP